VGEQVWLNVRAVKEQYKYRSVVVNGTYADLSSIDDKVNGSHVGINLLYAF
jgi:nitroimidazol reductase NimA-like FMN-containing flavoprotein (pyridoxamine 5'-phosphate oxidase superfamily)